MNTIIEAYNYLKCLVIAFFHEELENYENGDYSDGNTITDDRADLK